jgi:hypothetical protein
MKEKTKGKLQNGYFTWSKPNDCGMGKKTLGLRAIKKLAEPVSASVLRELMMQVPD